MLETDLNCTLLYGENEYPLANLAGMEATAFDALSVVDKFLINSTLVTYAIEGMDYPYEITETEQEKYLFGPNFSEILSSMGYEKVLAAAPLLIRLHLQHQCLLHPGLIFEIFDHPDDWIEYHPSLIKLIRRKGRWMADMKPEWSWWTESINPDTWKQRAGKFQYQFFRLIRSARRTEANDLLLQSWNSESPQSGKILLDIFREHLTAEDGPCLIRLMDEASDLNRREIRALLFVSSDNQDIVDFREQILRLDDPREYFGNGSKVVLTDILPYNEEDAMQMPREWIPFIDPLSAKGNAVLKGVKNQYNDSGQLLSFYNDILYYCLYAKRWKELRYWVHAIWSAQTSFRIERSWIYYFNTLSTEEKNKIILDLIDESAGGEVLLFLNQVLECAIIEMNRESSESYLSLIERVMSDKTRKKGKIQWDDVLVFLPFALNNRCLQDLHNLIAKMKKEISQLKVKNFLEITGELITFRNKIDRAFHDR